MDYSEIGRHARVRRAIIDKNVYVPEGDEIGYDLERDRQRFHVTDSGLVVIRQGPQARTAKPVTRSLASAPMEKASAAVPVRAS